ncbi:aldo/keto reductase [Streptomyces sp. IMTB 2501]|uniref:aldo/keto reductase n=1 Tax=Streptomyces sp. IMTB 2501 TaxID=1776340 RepID=UPI00096FCB04|nr:aldo/keto reductase [Streptomyces sp. IMTB 2501]OLZ61276.1 aldo/keto reductase [Streptomyces sp. IMTB 2501]
MKTRPLGTTGWNVGRIGLGCMGMSFAYTPGRRDDAESAQVIRRAVDLGVTLVDTADVYGPHTNEELVGKALTGLRDDVVLAGKCGLVVRDGDIVPDGRPEHIRAAADGSLARLGVDEIDLYQLHRVDPQVPVEETWGAMAELVRAGKVRRIGMSEATVAELDAAHAVHEVATVQSELSLWSQDQLEAVVPWCAAHGAAFIAYGPLGRAFLTGAVKPGHRLEDGDWRRGNPRFQDAAITANQHIAQGVADIAAAHRATPAQVALAWVLAQAPDIVPIPGTKRLAHLEENVRADGVELTADEITRLTALGRTAEGPRY